MAQETIIRPAQDVETIARPLIAEYHPELSEACILYLFTTAAASCVPQKCNPKMRYLASLHVKGMIKAEVASGPDCIVWVNEMEWELLVTGQHRPFVDHRLTHIGVEHTSEGTPRFVLVPHPIEEHPEVIQRFGAWNATIKQVRDLLQPELDFLAADNAASEKTSMTLNVPGYAPVSATLEDFQKATDAIKRGLE